VLARPGACGAAQCMWSVPCGPSLPSPSAFRPAHSADHHVRHARACPRTTPLRLRVSLPNQPWGRPCTDCSVSLCLRLRATLETQTAGRRRSRAVLCLGQTACRTLMPQVVLYTGNSAKRRSRPSMHALLPSGVADVVGDADVTRCTECANAYGCRVRRGRGARGRGARWAASRTSLSTTSTLPSLACTSCEPPATEGSRRATSPAKW
jgi:hypothetical protein